MPRNPIQELTITEEGWAGGKTALRYDHPAYAQVSANRISGSAVLYGSDFTHQNFVRIRVAKSSVRRDLSNDWVHADMSPISKST